MLNWYTNGRYNLTPGGKYSITRSYNKLLGQQRRWRIAELAWTVVVQPKDRFILWLAEQRRLLTKERLANMHIPVEDGTCCLCDGQQIETTCIYLLSVTGLSKVSSKILTWADVQLLPGEVKQMLESIKAKHWKPFKKEIVAAIWGAVIYHTWRARNWKKFKHTIVQADIVIIQIKKEIIERLDLLELSRKADRCRGHIQKLIWKYEKKNTHSVLIASVCALLLVALICFCGYFLCKKLRTNDGRGLTVDVGTGASVVMFHGDLPYSSKDIIDKLEALTEEEIIGLGPFGTTYKLRMDDGNIFAIKMKKGFDRYFSRELEILGSLKHRYMVNLRGYCNSPTLKFLMYDFLSGGRLDEVLHERSEQLDWNTRLIIIMGAAKALAYLHHDCWPRIIHRDIKSSNILLDGNFEARLSDFGLAKFLEDEESDITTIVAGTFGYLDPDYMQSGRATEKSDVYSFGVLVLEVVSGKRPTDASFSDKGVNIAGWLKFLATENKQRDMVDPHCRLVKTESLDALLSVATQCVSSNPEERPTMQIIVQIIDTIVSPCPSNSNSDG
ncbi:hypothetical protein MTR67_033798 [Solanum verrucosum]|uniref:non-specific serine/threonine protein kinase n=2 Tax=Solanum verrucosum TaxID=315347 RepID=A0AAF0ZJM3_SOLVR|nr:hypothetical protein MTR67_033798 [Solanum verrucosum]